MLRTVRLCIYLLLAASGLLAQQAGNDALNINYQKFVLPNGLTLVVHTDHQNPIVAVNMWYHVGSKNERVGKTGFAHMFEHLMFNGSEHYPHSFREAMDNLGATNRNGTTNVDRTNFFQVVPTSALERTLYLESDRMGWLLGAVDEKMLERERGVVKNEKRQGENQPYGLAFSQIFKAMYPAKHPYSWSTIGEMEDLNAASLNDVREWFKTYYGPANCIISLAGDITPERAKELVTKYFGAIPSGPPLGRYQAWIPGLAENMREQLADRVPQTRIYRCYHVPAWGTKALDYFNLTANVLSGSKSARLDRKLVYEKQLCTSMNSFVFDAELGSMLIVIASVKPGVAIQDAEQEMDNVLQSYIAQGPTQDELDRAKVQFVAGWVRNTADVLGRADLLAEHATFGNDPSLYKQRLAWVNASTTDDLKQAAGQWLTRKHYTLEIAPFAEYKTTADLPDRNKLPDLGAPPTVKFPTVQRAQLKNGVKVVLAERKGAPLVNVNLVLDAGIAADPKNLAGTATFVSQMLTEGTMNKDAFTIADALERLGANLFAQTRTDINTVKLDALKMNLDASVALMAEVALQPAFPTDKVEVLRRQRLAAIGQERANPNASFARVANRILYGDAHPYGHAASGYETSIKALKREDLAAWHQGYFVPSSATIVVTGDISLAEATALLEKYFGGWKGSKAPEKKLATVNLPAQSRVYLIDKPGAVQSFIAAGHISMLPNQPDELALETVMRQFGGMATARLNLNLRMDKHWSYGYGAGIQLARGQRTFGTSGAVQTDKTKESMVEILKEIKDIAGARPIAGEEYKNLMNGQISRLAGRFENLDAVEAALINMAAYGYPEAYYYNFGAAAAKLTEADLLTTAKRYVNPDKLTWIVIGDRAKIEAGIRELNLGELVLIDADGNAVK